jgi:hypothetical protein
MRSVLLVLVGVVVVGLSACGESKPVSTVKSLDTVTSDGKKGKNLNADVPLPKQ